MAGSAQARSRRVPVLPEEVVVWDILVRLPAKELLRCRRVCPSWRRLTSTAGFLLAHHRRQPSLPLIRFDRKDKNKDGFFNTVVDAFDLRQAPAKRRLPLLGFRNQLGGLRVVLYASCDGLLLLQRGDRFDICNPATRQWVSLPALKDSHIAGLYPHESSGEYRVLYWKQRFVGDKAVFYILTVGTEQPRCIIQPMPEGVDFARLYSSTPVLLHSCLHWIYDHNRLVVFDTVVESFRWMRAPMAVGVHYCHSFHLHEVQGTLAISAKTETGERGLLKIWALTDYEREVWSFVHQILSPEITSFLSVLNSNYTVVSEKASTQFLYSTCEGMFHSDNKGMWREDFLWESSCEPWITNHLFKESLISHAFFPKQGRCHGEEQYFLRGIGGVK